jgi:hypothetical protein
MWRSSRSSSRVAGKGCARRHTPVSTAISCRQSSCANQLTAVRERPGFLFVLSSARMSCTCGSLGRTRIRERARRRERLPPRLRLASVVRSCLQDIGIWVIGWCDPPCFFGTPRQRLLAGAFGRDASGRPTLEWSGCCLADEEDDEERYYEANHGDGDRGDQPSAGCHGFKRSRIREG